MSPHGLFRDGVTASLRDTGAKVVARPGYAFPRGRHAEIAIVDLDHASEDAQLLVARLRDRLDGAYLVVVGTPARIAASANYPDAELETGRVDAEMLRAAVAKRPPHASAVLVRAHRLWAQVTPRQRDVLRQLAGGLDNPTIGERLGIGERAVKAHISALLVLFGVENRTQLALLARAAGLRA